jgi:hypothetical protein
MRIGIRLPVLTYKEARARKPGPTTAIRVMVERYAALMSLLRAQLPITPEELFIIATHTPPEIPAWGIAQLWNYLSNGDELGPLIEKLKNMPTPLLYAIVDAKDLMQDLTIEEARRVLWT